MITLTPGRLKGTIDLPPCKSISIRTMAAMLLCGKAVTLKGAWPKDNNTICEDILSAYRLVHSIGAQFVKEDVWPNAQVGKENKRRQLDCGNSALTMRVFAPILALSSAVYCLRGRSTLIARPTDFVVQGLRELGCWCEGVKVLPTLSVLESLKKSSISEPTPPELGLSHPVMLVQGPLHGGHYKVNAGGSSQFLSGLIMALPMTGEDSVLEVAHLESPHYIALTLWVMKQFGVEVTHQDYHTFYIPGRQRYKSNKMVIEACWGAAGYFAVGASLYGNLRMGPLDTSSLQAEKAILEALERSGASWEFRRNNILQVMKNPHPKAFEFNAHPYPDLFPALMALAVHCHGTSYLQGIDHLLEKDAHRAFSLMDQFRRMGAQLWVEGNQMVVQGGPLEGGVTVSSTGDHRVAMALAIAALGARNPVIIEEEEAVSKSYPDFWKELAQAHK